MRREFSSGGISNKTFPRDEIGISILGKKVLTNSGTWRELLPSVSF